MEIVRLALGRLLDWPEFTARQDVETGGTIGPDEQFITVHYREKDLHTFAFRLGEASGEIFPRRDRERG